MLEKQVGGERGKASWGQMLKGYESQAEFI